MSGQAHLVGVCGVGMSALAQALIAAGWAVTGSDRYLDIGQDLAIVPKLRRAGVRFVPQDGSGIRGQTQAVVASTAIEAHNPDLLAAARCGVSVLHRAQMLAKLAEGKECIAITGTSGKTTVTGMVGFLLEQLGDDPTVVNGGAVVNWESEDTIGNARIGKSSRWVIEADESDRSLLCFQPTHAVITNVSADHFSLADAERLFEEFAGQVAGCVLGPDKDLLRGVPMELTASGARFTYGGQEFRVRLLGRHNVENAINAIRLCETLGHPLGGIAEALAKFQGIRRRLDVAGTAAGVTVIDDYAHNPAKIRAAWQAVAPHYRRVLAVWRPHGFGPLAKMFDDVKRVFREMGQGGACIYILPVYYVGGTANPTVTSQTLVDELKRQGAPINFAADYDDLVDRLSTRTQAGDAVLIMGARDPELPAVARRLVGALAAHNASEKE